MALLDLRPLPARTVIVQPTIEQIDFYSEHGYLVVDRITTDEELEWLTELYEHVFDRAHAHEQGAPVDRSTEIDDTGPPLLTQAFMPEFNYPQLLLTNFYRNARRFAAALLAVDVERLACWSHMIRKLPGAREVPWHQDEAYWEPEYEYHALACWLPLHDVDLAMGTMQFILGSHRWGLIPHRAHNGDVRLHVLTTDVDASAAIVCPLTAGGCTFHDKNTLHYTAPNATDRTRLAWPMEFEVMPVRRVVDVSRQWVDEWRETVGHTPPTAHPRDGRWVAY